MASLELLSLSFLMHAALFARGAACSMGVATFDISAQLSSILSWRTLLLSCVLFFLLRYLLLVFAALAGFRLKCRRVGFRGLSGLKVSCSRGPIAMLEVAKVTVQSFADSGMYGLRLRIAVHEVRLQLRLGMRKPLDRTVWDQPGWHRRRRPINAGNTAGVYSVSSGLLWIWRRVAAAVRLIHLKFDHIDLEIVTVPGQSPTLGARGSQLHFSIREASLRVEADSGSGQEADPLEPASDALPTRSSSHSLRVSHTAERMTCVYSVRGNAPSSVEANGSQQERGRPDLSDNELGQVWMTNSRLAVIVEHCQGEKVVTLQQCTGNLGEVEAILSERGLLSICLEEGTRAPPGTDSVRRQQGCTGNDGVSGRATWPVQRASLKIDRLSARIACLSGTLDGVGIVDRPTLPFIPIRCHELTSELDASCLHETSVCLTSALHDLVIGASSDCNLRVSSFKSAVTLPFRLGCTRNLADGVEKQQSVNLQGRSPESQWPQQSAQGTAGLVTLGASVVLTVDSVTLSGVTPNSALLETLQTCRKRRPRSIGKGSRGDDKAGEERRSGLAFAGLCWNIEISCSRNVVVGDFLQDDSALTDDEERKRCCLEIGLVEGGLQIDATCSKGQAKVEGQALPHMIPVAYLALHEAAIRFDQSSEAVGTSEAECLKVDCVDIHASRTKTEGIDLNIRVVGCFIMPTLTRLQFVCDRISNVGRVHQSKSAGRDTGRGSGPRPKPQLRIKSVELVGFEIAFQASVSRDHVDICRLQAQGAPSGTKNSADSAELGDATLAMPSSMETVVCLVLSELEYDLDGDQLGGSRKDSFSIRALSVGISSRSREERGEPPRRDLTTVLRVVECVAGRSKSHNKDGMAHIDITCRGFSLFLDSELLLTTYLVFHQPAAREMWTRTNFRSKRQGTAEVGQSREKSSPSMMKVHLNIVDCDAVWVLRREWIWMLKVKRTEYLEFQTSLDGVDLSLNDQLLASADKLSICHRRLQSEEAQHRVSRWSTRSDTGTPRAEYVLRTTMDQTDPTGQHGGASSLVRLLSPLSTSAAYEALRSNFDNSSEQSDDLSRILSLDSVGFVFCVPRDQQVVAAIDSSLTFVDVARQVLKDSRADSTTHFEGESVPIPQGEISTGRSQIIQVCVSLRQARVEVQQDPLETWLSAQRQCLCPCIDELLLREEQLKDLGRLTDKSMEHIQIATFRRFKRSWEAVKETLKNGQMSSNLAAVLSSPEIKLKLNTVRASGANAARMKCTQAVRAMENVNEGISFSKILGWDVELTGEAGCMDLHSAHGRCTVMRLKKLQLSGPLYVGKEEVAQDLQDIVKAEECLFELSKSYKARLMVVPSYARPPMKVYCALQCSVHGLSLIWDVQNQPILGDLLRKVSSMTNMSRAFQRRSVKDRGQIRMSIIDRIRHRIHGSGQLKLEGAFVSFVVPNTRATQGADTLVVSAKSAELSLRPNVSKGLASQVRLNLETVRTLEDSTKEKGAAPKHARSASLSEIPSSPPFLDSDDDENETSKDDQSDAKFDPSASKSLITIPLVQLTVEREWSLRRLAGSDGVQQRHPSDHYVHARPFLNDFEPQPLTVEIGDADGPLVADSLASFRARKLLLRVDLRLLPEGEQSSLTPLSVADRHLTTTPEMALSFWDMIRLRRLLRRLFRPPPQFRTSAGARRSDHGTTGAVQYPVGDVKTFSEICHTVSWSVTATPLVVHYIASPLDPAYGLSFTVARAYHSHILRRSSCALDASDSRDKLRSSFVCADFEQLQGTIYDNGTKNDNGDGSDSINEVNKSSFRLRQLRELLALSPPNSTNSEKSYGTPFGLPPRHRSPGVAVLQSASSEFVVSADRLLLRKYADPLLLDGLSEKDRTIVRDMLHHMGSVEDYSMDSSVESKGRRVEGLAKQEEDFLRVAVHGLKLLWTLQTRDAVLGWIKAMRAAFAFPFDAPRRPKHERLDKDLVQQAALGAVAPSPSCDGLGQSSRFPSTAVGASTVSGSVEEISEHDTQTKRSPEDLIADLLKGGVSSGSSVTHQRPGSGESVDKGTVSYVIDILQPQVNLQSDECNGRLLLAATQTRATGRRLEEGAAALGILALDTDDFQAYVCPTDVDLSAGVQWLKWQSAAGSQREKGNTVLPEQGQSSLLRRISEPCVLQMRHSSPVRDSPLVGVAARGQELSVWLPEIVAGMESRPFAVLTDVVGNLMLGKLRVVEPGPARPHESLLSVQDKALHSALQMAAEADAMKLGGLVDELLAMERKTAYMAELICCVRSRLTSTDSQKGLPISDTSFFSLPLDKTRLEGIAVVLNDVEDSLQSAGHDLDRKRDNLQKQLRHARISRSRQPLTMSFEIGSILWNLKASTGTFVSGELTRLFVGTIRSEDGASEILFNIQNLVLTNRLVAHEPSELLAPLNTPEPWRKESMFRLYAKQRAPVANLTAIAHLEVNLHPLKVYLTEKAFVYLHEYFFPRQDVRDDFMQTLTPNAPAKRRSRKKRRGRGRDLDSIFAQLDTAQALAAASSSDTEGPSEKMKGKQRKEELDITESPSNLSDGDVQGKEPATPTKKSKKSLVNITYCRFNEVRVVVSYEGSPITFHGVKLIIPPVLYRDYMGPWRGLFMQLKKDVKWSVLRAVARLMGKKISELLPDSRDKQHAIPPESSSAMVNHSSSGAPVLPDVPIDASSIAELQANEESALISPHPMPNPGESKGKGKKGISRLFRSAKKSKSRQLTDSGRALNDLTREIMDDAEKRRLLLGMQKGQADRDAK